MDRRIERRTVTEWCRRLIWIDTWLHDVDDGYIIDLVLLQACWNDTIIDWITVNQSVDSSTETSIRTHHYFQRMNKSLIHWRTNEMDYPSGGFLLNSIDSLAEEL